MPRFERPRRLLVVANETNASLVLLDEVQRLAESARRVEVMIIAPALPASRLHHWCGDVQGARDRAQARLELCLDELHRRGLAAAGALGDADPLHAIEDALGLFPADELLVATLPPARSHWLERGLIGRVRVRFGLPVTHVVAAEPAAAAAGVASAA